MPEWDQIVSENLRSIFRIAVRILGSDHDAEDVTQDVFREAIELEQLQTVSDWPGMLRRMATLRSIDRLRRRRSMAEIDASSSVEANPIHDVIATELAERLRVALLQLPERQAAVFSLAYFESLSRDEIAGSLGIAPAAVSTALYQARQKLQSILVVSEAEIRYE